MSSNATVKVNGTSVSGGKVSVDLNNGYKEITIEVTAPDGTTKKTYALTVRTHIDPANPYKTLYTGEHTETVTLAIQINNDELFLLLGPVCIDCLRIRAVRKRFPCVELALALVRQNKYACAGFACAFRYG